MNYLECNILKIDFLIKKHNFRLNLKKIFLINR